MLSKLNLKAKPFIMKKVISRSFASALLVGFLMISGSVLADAPPDPGGDPNTGGGTPVGGSPIGSGLVILMTMGAAYGMKKVYKLHTNESDD